MIEEHINKAYEALADALSAIETMDDEALGRDHLHGYYYKDELIDKMCEAMSDLGEHMEHKTMMKLNHRDPFGHLK